MSRIVISFWEGNRLSDVEKVCLRSYENLGYNVHIFSYSPINNLPSNAKNKDANAVINRNKMFFNQHGQVKTLAQFSDYFRLKYLHDYGGIWTDLDIVCLRDFKEINMPQFVAWEDAQTVNGAVMKLNKNSLLAKKGINNFENPKNFYLKQLLNKNKVGLCSNISYKHFLCSLFMKKYSLSKAPWGVLGGPDFLTRNLDLLKKQNISILPKKSFYPVGWKNVDCFFDFNFDYQSNILEDENVYAVHLYGSFFKKQLNAYSGQKCFWSYLKNKYL